MAITLRVVLLIAAAICFLLAVIGLEVHVSLVALGLLLWVLAEIFGGVKVATAA